MKKKIFGFLMFVLVFLVVSVNPTFAEESQNQLKPRVLHKTNESFTLKWNNVPSAKEYRIYDGNNLIYQGNERSFNLSNLDEGQYLELLVIALGEQNEILTNSIVSSSSLSDEALFDIEIISEKEEVYISWNSKLKRFIAV